VSRSHKPIELDAVSIDQRFVIRENMTADEIALGIADAFCSGNSEARKRVRERLRNHLKRGRIPYSKTNPAQFSQNAIVHWVSEHFPEISGRLSFERPENLAMALGAGTFQFSGRDMVCSEMPGDIEGCWRLITDLRRRIAELEAEAKLSKKLSDAGRKGGRGNQA
jgi:hypothetical protein